MTVGGMGFIPERLLMMMMMIRRICREGRGRIGIGLNVYSVYWRRPAALRKNV